MGYINEIAIKSAIVLKASIVVASIMRVHRFQIDGAVNVQPLPPAGLFKRNLCVLWVPNSPPVAPRALDARHRQTARLHHRRDY